MRLHLLLLLLCPPLGLLATGSRVAGALLLACMILGLAALTAHCLPSTVFLLLPASYFAACLHGLVTARRRRSAATLDPIHLRP